MSDLDLIFYALLFLSAVMLLMNASLMVAHQRISRLVDFLIASERMRTEYMLDMESLRTRRQEDTTNG